MKKIYAFLTIAATIAITENSFAQNTCESALLQAYTSSIQSGNQAYQGELGMQFFVGAGGITVKQLGVFDDGGNGITGTQSGGIRVAIFDRSTLTQVTGLDVIISGNGDAYTGNFRMKNVTPVTLPAGEYVLVTKGFNSGERNGNVIIDGGPYPAPNDGGGAVGFGNVAFYGPDNPSGFNFPSSNGPTATSQSYLSGTFAYVTTSSCALSNIASLSNITLSDGTLTPSFVQGTTGYTADVANSVTSITVTPSATDAGATITVNGNTTASGSPSSSIALAEGSNAVSVVVTAQNGTTTATYSFTVTRASATLPVVLTNFNATLTTDKKVALSWTTQQETNSANFDVQKSSDGIHWLTVALVKAAGNSSKPINYSTTDESPINGSNLYRIRSNDLDGKFAVSVVKNVRVTALGKISLYPNPSTDIINISLGSTPAGDWTLSVINNSGQVVLQKKYSKSTTTVSLPVNKYTAGNYTVQITDGDSRQINKIVISH